MKDFKKLLKGSIYVSITSLLAGLISYLVRLFLARTLSLEDYGLYFSVFSFVSFLLLFRDFGIGQALARNIAKFRVKKQFNEIKSSISAVFMIQLVASTVIVGVLLLFSDYLSIHFFKKPEAALVLKLFTFYVYFSFVALLIKFTILGFQKDKLFSLYEPVKNVGIILSIIIGSYFTLSATLPVIGYSLGWVFVTVLFLPSFLRTFSFFKYKITNFWSHSKKLLFFGLPLLFASVGEKVMGNIDTIMLTYFTNLELVGIYQVVLPTSMLFLFLANGLNTLILPLSSKLWIKNDKKTLEKLITEIYKCALILVLPCFVFLVLQSDKIIYYFFGNRFLQGTLTLQILLGGILFLFFSDFNSRLIIGFGKPKTVFLITILAAMFNIVLNYILINNFNIVGAAIATNLSYFATLALSFFVLSKSVKTTIKPIWILKALIISIILVILNKGIEVLNLTGLIEISLILLLNGFLLFLFNITYLRTLFTKNF